MLEHLNFSLICAILASIFYLYIQIKKYFPILKMAEELIGNLGYGAPQSDTKRQKLLECVLTGNSKLYLGKVYTEEKLTKLNEEEVEKLFNNYEAKLLSQMVKYDAPCLTKITLDNWRCFGQVEVLSTAGGTLHNWRYFGQLEGSGQLELLTYFFFKYVAFSTGFNLLTLIFMLPYIIMDVPIFVIAEWATLLVDIHCPRGGS